MTNYYRATKGVCNKSHTRAKKLLVSRKRERECVCV